MNNISKVVFLLLSLWAGEATAAACTSAATGNWSAQTTWGAAGVGCVGATGGIPGAADTVTIGATHTVTLTAPAAASSVSITAATAANGIVLNGNTLTVSGAVTMNATSTNNITSTFNAGSGTLNAATISIAGGAGNRVALMLVNTGTINTTGNITFAGTAANARFTSTGASTVNVGGNFGSGGTLTTGGTGTINFNGGAAQTIGAYATYNNITISNTAGGVALAGNATIGGALSVNTGTLTVGAFTLAVTGATTVNSTLSITSTTGAKTFTGNVTINTGGTLSETVAELITYGGDVTINTGGTLTEFGAATMACAGNLQNDGTYTASTGVHTFSGAAKTFSGANPIVIPSVAVTGTYTNSGTFTVATALTGAGTLTNGNGTTGTLNIGGTSTITGLTANAVGNTVNYTGVAQTVKATTYHHLTLSGSGAKTMGATTINGDFTMSGTATTAPTGALAVGGNFTIGLNNTFTAGALVHSVGGNWNNSGTFAANTSTVILNGAAAQSIGGAATTTFNNLTISNTATAIAAITGFNTNGTLTANANTVLSPSSGVIVGGSGTLTGSGAVQVTRTAAVADFASQYTITTRTLTNLTVEYIGAAAQTVSALTYGSATGGGLKVNNASGVSLTANTTVAGTLTLASGVVNAGAFTLISTGDCTTKVARTGGHVAGLLQLAFPTGAPSCTFHVGDATAYRPINASFASVTVAGSLVGSVSQAAGEHPNIATSGLDSTKDVNRYWTLTNPVGGTIAYTTYTGTFNFINPTDFDAGATPANFEIERWNGAAWNVTTLSSATAASTAASGLPFFAANSSNSFAVGEKIPPPVVVSINRADADPTSAAIVSWTATFSKSVAGVDATDFALAATGMSGAFITAVTGSGTAWTVTANTGIGSGTLGLNLVDDDTIADTGGRKLGGTGTGNGNFTGEVYTISVTPALAEYRMDEASWNGTANEVVDSSGSGNHAQAFNNANTTVVTGQEAKPGDPGTCRYGVFDNGGTITQGYVQTPLPNLATDFTVTAWIRTTNNAVAGQRILIDDQNNSGGYGISLGDGAAGILRFYSRGITPIILDSTYTIANNTWYFMAAVADITNKKRTIYVFDQSGALLSSTTEAAWTGGAWGTDAGPVSIGAETNTSAESPATFHFRGNLDEVRVYQKVLSQSALAAIATQSHVCPINLPDHLEIQSSGSGLTCAASTLTIKACADAPCTLPYTGGVSGTLTATGAGMTVNWDGTTGGAAGAGFAIPNGGSQMTKDVQVATAGSVVLGITFPSPLPINGTSCNFGTPACTFTANTAGFIFSDTTTGNSYTIPAQVSGIATPTLYLRAMQASTTNPAVCTPAIISQTTTVNMGYACNNPATCQADNLATLNATAIASSGTAVSLTFDANGSAPVTARYDDVGQITLNANKIVTPFGGATAVTLNGSSNSFVVAPHHFGFSDITAGPIKAGNNFSATVTAYNGLATPTVTANFGRESAAEGVTLVSNLVSPAGGNNSGIGNNVIPGSEFGAGGMANDANGVATINNLSWGEVGNITLTANLTSGNYLGSTLTATGTSGNVGRFIPDHFDTVVKYDTVSKVFMPCPPEFTCPASGDVYGNGFVYSGQPFSVKVSARNTSTCSGSEPDVCTTQNYQGIFAKNVTLSAWDAAGGATANPGSGTLNPNAVPSTAFNLGVATMSTPIYMFPTTPVAPTDIYIRAMDTDNVTSLRGVSSVEGGIKIVSGRVKISNAHGSELLPLPMTATVQYWSGANWVTSTTDDVTSFNTAADIVASIVKGPLASVSVASAGTVTVAGGMKTFTLNKPLVAGSADISLSAPGYLLAGSNAAAVNPSKVGRATFGVYKGNNDFIYLRENY